MQFIISSLERDLQRLNKFHYFLIFCILSMVLLYATRSILFTDELYYDFFIEQLAYDRITDLINTNKKFEWAAYVFLPIFYLLKFFLISCCLSVGAELVRYPLSFKRIFQIVMIAESVFLIPQVTKVIWFSLFETNYSFNDLQYFSPLSVLSLIPNKSNIESWLVYPLQLINAFELFYWFSLAYGLSFIAQEKFLKMLGLVSSTYGLGLLVWTTFIVFITISFA